MITLYQALTQILLSLGEHWPESLGESSLGKQWFSCLLKWMKIQLKFSFDFGYASIWQLFWHLYLTRPFKTPWFSLHFEGCFFTNSSPIYKGLKVQWIFILRWRFPGTSCGIMTIICSITGTFLIVCFLFIPWKRRGNIGQFKLLTLNDISEKHKQSI